MTEFSKFFNNKLEEYEKEEFENKEVTKEEEDTTFSSFFKKRLEELEK